MENEHGWKRRFVAYVEARNFTASHLFLSVKIPRATADAVNRECAEKGTHAMVYYADAFATGVNRALNVPEVKTLA
jgi:hypothetical protein